MKLCCRYLLAFSICCLLAGIHLSAQGTYAGSMKKMIGHTYTDSRDIPNLKGWQLFQGSVMSELTDPEMILVNIYRKGSTYIFFFSVKKDSAHEEYEIVDIAEVKNVRKGYEIKTSLCRENRISDLWIVALVKPSVTKEYWQAARAWRFNRDKRKIERLNAGNVDCSFEGYEQF